MDNPVFFVIMVAVTAFALLGLYSTLRYCKHYALRVLGKKPAYQRSTLRPSDQRLKDFTRYLLDKAPYPAWVRRGKKLQVAYCNAAYAAAVDSTQQEVIENNIAISKVLGDDGTRMSKRALQNDTTQSESHTVVLQGKRKLMEFTEIPVVDGSAVVGYAIDHSPIEQLQQELERHTTAHQNILGYLNNAVAVYGPDKHLQFYNKAFIKLWRLDKSFLDNQPRFEDVLEELRTHRRIPEHANFPGFKKEMAAQFQTLLTPKQQILHLPDERIIRQTVLPHPLAGLMFIDENITDNIALQRQNTVLTETFEASLNTLQHPVLMVNADQQLTFANSASEQWSTINLKEYAKKKDSIQKVLKLLPENKQPESIEAVTAALGYKDAVSRNYREAVQFRTERIPYGNTMLQILA